MLTNFLIKIIWKQYANWTSNNKISSKYDYILMKSKTFILIERLLKKLSLKRRRSLLTLLPIAIITGLIDLLVVALVSRVFTVVVGQENKPSIPY